MTDDRERRDDFRFFGGWMVAEWGNYAEVLELFQAAEANPEVLDWAAFDRGFVGMRKHKHEEVERLLGEIRTIEETVLLRATVAHVRWANIFHLGNSERALRPLGEALRLMVRDHLVREIGDGLRAVNPEAHARHDFRRVQGRAMPDDIDSLVTGISEPLTALFLDLKGSTA